MMSAKYFEYYTIMLGGPFFPGHTVVWGTPANFNGFCVVCLKIEIHEIHLICEIPKYRNPLQLNELHCLKVEIHKIHVQTCIAKNRNPQNPHT